MYLLDMKNLPPLNTLRVFEAAGRLLSFNAAAQELHLTPSAISHAIKTLEAFLGVPLFNRPGRGVALTVEGRIFLPPVREALDQINNSAASLMTQRDNQPLTVSATPSLTIGWLMPRLAKFQLQHPDIEVRLSSSPDIVDLQRSDIDLAIRSGSGHWSGLTSHFLMSEKLAPVCKPGLRGESNREISTPQDLQYAPLLHVIPTMGQWRSWLNAEDVKLADPEKGPKFESSSVAVEAAIAGLGVALVPGTFVEDHIRSGRLTRLFDRSVSSQIDFYIVYPSEQATVPRIAAFRDWILAEANP
jgi:LysR family transcriptional regulator, glycine cleavage system transcriptional activator